VIHCVNEKARWSLGVDLPSGIDADTGCAGGEAVRCRATVTFGLPKKGHFLLDGLDVSGELHVADIGFPQDLLESAESDADWVTPSLVSSWLPTFPRSTHKGARGHTLLIAGSSELLGAAILAARGCLAMGTGLLTLGIPASLNQALKVAVPECMTLPLLEESPGHLGGACLPQVLSFAEKVEAAGIGPGLGNTDAVQNLVAGFLGQFGKPVVVDADGLNALAKLDVQKILASRQASTVLTPHPGEMSRLLGLNSIVQVENRRWEIARESTEAWQCTVLLKGAATVISTPGCTLHVTRTGHPGMAQGGMGDVLTGMILAMLGQGMGPHESAVCSAYLHGKTGEILGTNQGFGGIEAGKLVEYLDQSSLFE
jgi:NAD(P)H-hydrate epimerase